MTLSDKIYIPKHSTNEDFELNGLIPVKAVKEFIKELKVKLMSRFDNKADGLVLNMDIDELAGEKLI